MKTAWTLVVDDELYDKIRNVYRFRGLKLRYGITKLPLAS